ncbi:MAG: hypothetical protein NVS2B16_29900 [Chloroflexota bacterium]
METNTTPPVEELWAIVREQQTRMAELEAQLEKHRAENPAQSGRVRDRETTEEKLSVVPSPLVVDGSVEPSPRRVSRSALLKAAAAGVAGVAGAEALTSATPAAAANGGTVILGTANAATSLTSIDVGMSGSAALRGTSTFSYGVWGFSNSGFGVYGYSGSSYGVAGRSFSTSDLAALGTGRLLLQPQSTPGAPTTGTYTTGEQLVDSRGDLYLCNSGDNTALGTWQAVGNLRSFPAPHRVFGDGSVTPAGSTTAAIDATAGSGVPVGATSAYCAVQASAGSPGPLTLFPDGAADPGIANYTVLVPNTLNLFYMLVPLSAAGKFKLHTYFTGSVYVDVWGYLY